MRVNEERLGYGMGWGKREGVVRALVVGMVR